MVVIMEDKHRVKIEGSTEPQRDDLSNKRQHLRGLIKGGYKR